MQVLFFLFFVVSSITALGQSSTVVGSPNQSIKVKIELDTAGQLYYSVFYKNRLVLEPSALGIERTDISFSKGLQWGSISAVKKVKDQYRLLHGKKKNCTYIANRRSVLLTTQEGEKMQLIFQVSDEGIAFRYVFTGDRSKKVSISRELSAFNFKESATAFLQPNMISKSGWNRTQPSYEEHYQIEIPVNKSAPDSSGWVLPALFRSDDVWVSITEAAVDSAYCGSHLNQHSPKGNYTIGFPMLTEGLGEEAVWPESNLSWSTPWRLITLSDKLATLIESTHGTDLAPPAAYDVDTWLKPGKASWSWIMFKDGSINYDMQKRYVDFAASMNWQYCLIDVNWDRRIGYERMKQLSAYAASKNVKLLVWYNSAGDWNTVTFYTPRNKLLTHASRIEEFEKLQEMGIAGIKVDFFPGDGQSAMKYYTDILKDAAKFKLAVNFHGSTYPRGWSRTYPNLVTMEAVKGQEFVTFNQRDANLQPIHCAILPFTRNLFDPMDYTPVNLSGIPGIIRRTTKGFELSLSVLFLSGIQHYAESDSGLMLQKPFVIDFLRTIPDRWEDVKFLDGYPGKFVVLARKSGNRWYITGINAEDKPLSLTLDLSFLGKQIRTASWIKDAVETSELQEEKLSLPTSLPLTIKPFGGFLIRTVE